MIQKCFMLVRLAEECGGIQHIVNTRNKKMASKRCIQNDEGRPSEEHMDIPKCKLLVKDIKKVQTKLCKLEGTHDKDLLSQKRGCPL